jgi:hypothetical protein
VMLVAIFGVSIAVTDWAFGATRKLCHSSCESSQGCGGWLVLDLNNSPWPLGCTKNGDNCAGTCYRCQNSTASNFCRYDSTEGAQCGWTFQQYVDCGTKFSYNCGGVWATYCTCPSVGGVNTGQGCKLGLCQY